MESILYNTERSSIDRLLTYKRVRAVSPVKSGTDFNWFLCSNLERKHNRMSLINCIAHSSFWNHERVRERAPILNEKGVPLISISPNK